MKSKALILLFFLVPFLSYSDTIPDVNALLKGQKPATQVFILDSLIEVYKSDRIDVSFKYLAQAFRICEENKLIVPLAKTYRARAALHRKNKNHDSVLIDLGEAEKIYISNKEFRELSGLYIYYGSYYYRLSEYKNASIYNFKALDVAEKAGYTEGKGLAYNNIGNVFFHEQNFDQAIDYYKQALEVYKQLNNTRRVATTYDNIGLAYSNKGDFQKAVIYQGQSVKVLERGDDKMVLAEGYFNLGTTYSLMNLNDSARYYLKKAYDIDKEIKYEIGLANIAYQLGIMYYNEKKFVDARTYLLEAFRLAEEQGLKVHIKDAAFYLSRIYEKDKDYVNALKYQRINANLLEKIYTEENTNALKEMSEKYQSEKKQKEIELLQKEGQVKDAKEKQLKTRNWALIGVSALILLVAIITYRRFTEKKKDNLVLEEKNVRITEQNVLIEEKNKSITDSITYAQRIQFSVLPTEQQVKSLLKDCFVYYAPKDIISGDFYWMVSKGDYIYFAVADCTGHGVPGALMSMLGTSFLNQIVLEKGLSETSDILKELHRQVLTMLNEDLENRLSKDGMDIALIRIDKKSKSIQYSGAGRPLYYVLDNRLEIVKADKMSVGGVYSLAETHYVPHKINIVQGLKMYLFSDGIPDQFGGPKQKKLTVKKVQEWIDINQLQDMAQQKKNFSTFIDDWKGKVEQIDDMTFVGIDFSKFA